MDSPMPKPLNIQRITAEPFHRKHRNLFVGLFVIIPLIALPVFMLYTFAKSSTRWEFLYAKYETAGSLTRNAAVTFHGIKIGYIDAVALNDAGYIDVNLKVNSKFMHLVKKDSKARLMQRNVAIGEWEIELADGSKTALSVVNGDTLNSVVQAPIAQTLENVNKTIETFQKILQNILDGKGTVGRIMKEDTLVTIAQSLGRNVNGLLVQARGTVARVDTVLVKVAQMGDKGKLLADTVITIGSKVSKLVSDVNLLVNSAQGAAKDVPQMMERVQSDMADVELMLKALQSNPIIKSGISTQSDPMLLDNPKP